MAGMGAPCGDAASLDGDAEADIGARIFKMLRICAKANVEPLAKRRTEALHRKWRGEDVPLDELLPSFDNATNWDSVIAPFPAIPKGPGTYHRTFAVAAVLDRDGWKSRKLTQLIRSPHAGCEENGDSIRIPISTHSKTLGSRLMSQMREW